MGYHCGDSGKVAIADVTIMGAGVFGLSVGYACAKRGAKVQVIDPNGVAAGSSGGLVGALAPHVPENWNSKKAFQFESLMMAETFWSDVCALTGHDVGYARSGRLQPLADETAVALARQRAVTAAELWEGRASWDVIAAQGLGAWAPPSPSGYVVRDTLTGLVHPRRGTKALAEAIVRLGGSVSAEGTAKGKVVWATGYSGLQDMTARHTRQVGTGVKGQAILLDYAAAGAPQLFADALHIVPHGDGTVAIGSTTEREFDEPVVVDDQLENVYNRAMAAFPVLADAPILERWAGVRPRSRSRAPMLGHHPFEDGAFVANGGFKIGFGMAPLMGEVMADLVLDDVNRIPEAFQASQNL
jgi:glycine oxidase